MAAEWGPEHLCVVPIFSLESESGRPGRTRWCRNINQSAPCAGRISDNMTGEGKTIKVYYQYLLCYCWLSFLFDLQLVLYLRSMTLGGICLPHKALLLHALLFLQVSHLPCAFISSCLLVFFLQDWNRTQQISCRPLLPFAPVEARSTLVVHTGCLHTFSTPIAEIPLPWSLVLFLLPSL